MQFQVPQFIDMESKIAGPLTLKQIFFLGGGFGIIVVIFMFLRLSIVIALSLPILGLSAAFAFLKINGRPFYKYFVSVFQYAFKPQLYVWQKVPESEKEKKEIKIKEKITESPEERKLTPKKLSDIAAKLDIGEK